MQLILLPLWKEVTKLGRGEGNHKATGYLYVYSPSYKTQKDRNSILNANAKWHTNYFFGLETDVVCALIGSAHLKHQDDSLENKNFHLGKVQVCKCMFQESLPFNITSSPQQRAQEHCQFQKVHCLLGFRVYPVSGLFIWFSFFLMSSGTKKYNWKSNLNALLPL